MFIVSGKCEIKRPAKLGEETYNHRCFQRALFSSCCFSSKLVRLGKVNVDLYSACRNHTSEALMACVLKGGVARGAVGAPAPPGR